MHGKCVYHLKSQGNNFGHTNFVRQFSLSTIHFFYFCNFSCYLKKKKPTLFFHRMLLYVHHYHYTLGMPSVSIPQSTYNVNFGDPITIPCNVTAVPIATNVSWVKTSNGVTVTVDLTSQPSKYSGSTVSNPNLTISSTDLTDEGNYVCSASNIVGTGSSNAAFLDVIGGKWRHIEWLCCYSNHSLALLMMCLHVAV